MQPQRKSLALILAALDFGAGKPLVQAGVEQRAVGISPAHPARWGDVVIARKDISTSYHLSVVVDDALQNVTHVTRGRDLYAATDIHRLLQVLLGLPAPLYHHHALLLDESGSKLSKSNKSKALASLRGDGASPQDIRAMAGL